MLTDEQIEKMTGGIKLYFGAPDPGFALEKMDRYIRALLADREELVARNTQLHEKVRTIDSDYRLLRNEVSGLKNWQRAWFLTEAGNDIKTTMETLINDLGELENTNDFLRDSNGEFRLKNKELVARVKELEEHGPEIVREWYAVAIAKEEEIKKLKALLATALEAWKAVEPHCVFFDPLYRQIISNAIREIESAIKEGVK